MPRVQPQQPSTVIAAPNQGTPKGQAPNTQGMSDLQKALVMGGVIGVCVLGGLLVIDRKDNSNTQPQTAVVQSSTSAAPTTNTPQAPSSVPAQIPASNNQVISTSPVNSSVASNISTSSQSLTTSSPITRDAALALVNKWQESKKYIFSPPYNHDLGAQLTTGEAYRKNKLPPVQFLSIVTGVVLVITLTGVAIARRSSLPSEGGTSVNEQKQGIPKVETLPPAPVLSSEPVQISPTTPLPPAVQVEPNNLQLAYNVSSSPNLQKSKKLQVIVNELVQTAAEKKLPTKPLSITLINTKTGEYAAYQQEELRFPASVVKTFWLVYFYEKVQKGLLNEGYFSTYLNKMIKESDNNSASVILDAITGTESGSDLKGEEYENWLNQRKQVNKYFQRAGYENINVNQKTFPITNIKLFEPKGADLKMRGNLEKPIRNKISAQQTARILYEIYSNQAVSAEQSKKMANLLTIEPQTRLVKKDEQDNEHFNPVKGFLSESLPSNIYFGAKAGWTSFTRNEAAYIYTPDRKTAYILVVFGEDKAYAYDWKIFPKMSKMVFEKMTKATQN